MNLEQLIYEEMYMLEQRILKGVSDDIDIIHTFHISLSVIKDDIGDKINNINSEVEDQIKIELG